MKSIADHGDAGAHDAGCGLRIAVVTETYPPEINGVANTLQRMVEGLSGLGHDLMLVRPRQRDERVNGTRHAFRVELTYGIGIPGYPGLQFGLPAPRRIDRLWHDFAPDLSYIATEGPLGRSALAACRRRRIPALTGMHTNFHQYSNHYGIGLLEQLIHRDLRRFHNRSQGTLVPTRQMADNLVADGFRDVHTWPRGVDAARFDPSRRDPELRRSWGAGDEDPVALYVGRIAPEKNVSLALTAYRRMAAVRPGTRFVLVGDGPATAELRAACPEAVFTGPKIGVELARHFASADLFLFPSLTETFGNVVLEAMASGLAVIAYDLAAALELIDHGRNGMTVAPDDTDAFGAAAEQLAAEDALRAHLGRQARLTATDNDWDSILRRLEALFRQVLVSRR